MTLHDSHIWSICILPRYKYCHIGHSNLLVQDNNSGKVMGTQNRLGQIKSSSLQRKYACKNFNQARISKTSVTYLSWSSTFNTSVRQWEEEGLMWKQTWQPQDWQGLNNSLESRTTKKTVLCNKNASSEMEYLLRIIVERREECFNGLNYVI